MIIADLDGVFADFAGASAALHGKWGTKITKWNFFLEWKLTPEMFWDKIHAEGEHFYREMVMPYPWAEELLLAIQRTDDFIIMSSPACGTPLGYASKKLWVDKYLQPFVVEPIKVIAGSEKHLLAGKDRLLIDDYDVNVERFRDAGGYAITFPQPWNKQRTMAVSSLRYTIEQLKQWKDMQLHELRQHKKFTDIKNKIKRAYPKGDSPGY